MPCPQPELPPPVQGERSLPKTESQPSLKANAAAVKRAKVADAVEQACMEKAGRSSDAEHTEHMVRFTGVSIDTGNNDSNSEVPSRDESGVQVRANGGGACDITSQGDIVICQRPSDSESKRNSSPSRVNSKSTSLVDTVLATEDSQATIETFRTHSFASVLAAEKTENMSIKARVRRKLLSMELQAVLVLIIFVDLTGFIIDETLSEEAKHAKVGVTEATSLLLWVNWGTLCCYACEATLGLWAFGLRTYLRSPWKMLDILIIVLALALVQGPGGVVIAARLGKAVKFLNVIDKMNRCVLRLVLAGKRYRTTKLALKRKVSQNKFRYINQEENIDLDLTYITTELIAMGVPVQSFIHGLYRNPLPDVVRFFNMAHPYCFRIYNACPEMPYSSAPFEAIGGQVVRIQVQDHTPPMMNQFIDFLTDCRQWREISEDHILVVHCKAGKGRTGSLCAAWLIYSRKRNTSNEALKMFATRRTDQRISPELRGVETPSQVRYVHQLFAHLKRTGCWLTSPLPPPKCSEPPVKLHTLSLHDGLIAKPARMKRIRVLVQCGGVNVQDLVLETPLVDASTTEFDLQGVEVKGDVRVSLFEERSSKLSAHEAMMRASNAYDAAGVVFFFLFHTDFMPWNKDDRDSGNELPGDRRTFLIGVCDLDKAHRMIKKGRHDPDSYVQLHFSPGASSTRASEGPSQDLVGTPTQSG